MKRLEKPEILFIVLTAVLFVVGRIGVLIWQEQNGILVAGKILISIEIILFAVLFYLQKKTSFGMFIMITVILYCLADAIINIYFPAAMALFAVGHIVFLIGSLRSNRHLKLWQILICAVLAVIILVGLIIFRARVPKALVVPIVCYMLLLFAAMLSSFNKGRLLSIGYILFTISDAMLAVKTAFPKTNAYMSHIVLAVYYVAVILITLRILRKQNFIQR
ncbi:MAG: hypothetical protein IKI32_01780 [Lachnospiraceae bacterium]|nr:hypothetical protein [Lachnospiraceae bacterium]